MAIFDIPKSRVIPFLRRAIGYANVDPQDFLLSTFPSVSAQEEYFRITCKKCSTYEEQAVCDWSEHYRLDNMIDMVIKFSKSHEHQADEEPDEELFTGRKFRY